MSASRRPAFDIISHSPDQTRALGAQLGRLLASGDVVLLSGNIGSGKTTLSQGLARALRVREPVGSPTFTLVSEYDATSANDEPLRLFHIDLYRIGQPDDVDSFGFTDILDAPGGVALVEWPERARPALPAEYLLVHFSWVADTKRQIEFVPRGARYLSVVDGLRAEVTSVRG